MKAHSCVVFSILMGTLNCSCTTVHDYPRCYLFRAPEVSDIAKANDETVKLMNALKIKKFAVAKDVVTVESRSDLQFKLEGIWPAYGCVNLRHPPPETGDINDKWVVARCQDFLDEVLKRNSLSKEVPRTNIAGKYVEFTCH